MTRIDDLKRRKSLLVLFGLIFAKLVLQLLLNAHAGLHRDEYLYLAFADHLDWGYVSVPPLIGIAAWITQHVFTDSAFWVRLPPVLAGLATMGFMGLTVMEVGGGPIAVLLAGLAFLFSPSYLRTNGLFQPVAPDILFWTASAWVFFRWLRTREPRWWALLFPLMAFAFLNKYMIAALGIGVIVAVLFTKDRKQLISRHALAGMAIALGIVLPNIAWQFRHHWPVVKHMAELNATQLVNVNRLGFVFDQLMDNLTGAWMWIAGLLSLLWGKRWKSYRPFGWTYLIVVGLLAVLRGKGYYTLGLYPPLFAVGGVALESLRGWKGRTLRITAAAFAVVLTLPVMPFSMPALSYPAMERYGRSFSKIVGPAGLVWEDGKAHAIPQDFADMTGWDEVGRKVRDVWTGLNDEEKKHTVIYADNYGMAGAIRYYGRRDGVPEPISFNDNFLLWAPDSLRLRTLIAVHEKDNEWTLSHFKTTRRIKIFDNPYFRECGDTVWLLSEPDSSLFRDYTDWLRSHRRD